MFPAYETCYPKIGDQWWLQHPEGVKALIVPTAATLSVELGNEKDVLSTIMTRKVLTIDADSKVEEALRLMVEFDVGSVIITRENAPIGVITERDVTRSAIRGDKLLSLPAASLMSTPIQTAPPNTEIWRAFETMIKLGVRRLPIVQGGKLIGIVTEKDLTRWVLRVFYEPNLPEEIKPLVEGPKTAR